MTFPDHYYDPETFAPARLGLLGRLAPMLRGGGLLGGFGTARGWPPAPGGSAPTPAAGPAPAAATGIPADQGGDAPMPLQPPPLPHDRASGPLGALGDWIGNNRSALMALGAGIAGGRNWGEGIGRGLQMAVSAAQSDRQRQTLAAQQAATVQALRARGIPDAELIAAMNPYFARILLSGSPRRRGAAARATTQPAAAKGSSSNPESPAVTGGPSTIAPMLGSPLQSRNPSWPSLPFGAFAGLTLPSMTFEPASVPSLGIGPPQSQPSIQERRPYKSSATIPQESIETMSAGDQLGDASPSQVWPISPSPSRAESRPSPEKIAITQNDISVQEADRILFGRNVAPTVTGSAYISGVIDGYATQNSDGSWTVSASREHPGIIVSISEDRSHAMVTTVTERDTVTIEPDGSISRHRA